MSYEQRHRVCFPAFLSFQYVVRMAEGWFPKYLLYGEWVQGNHPRERPQLCYKEICKRDLKALGMDLNRRSAWRQVLLHHGLSQFEETLVHQAKAKRQTRNQQNQGAGRGTDCICLQCWRDGHSRLGLLNHTRCYSKSSIQNTLPSYLETEGCLLLNTSWGKGCNKNNLD